MAVFMANQKVELRPVPGYGGKYSVGSDGSVWRDGSALRVINGLYVSLSDAGKVDKVRVAYLVARAFIANSEMRPYVRHKDRNARNNKVENLEWSEEKEELRGKRAPKQMVTVWRKDSGDLVGSWNSVEEACAALRVRVASARRVIRGGAASIKGYIFKV